MYQIQSVISDKAKNIESSQKLIRGFWSSMELITVSSKGLIMIWNLAVDILHPITVNMCKMLPLTCLALRTFSSTQDTDFVAFVTCLCQQLYACAYPVFHDDTSSLNSQWLSRVKLLAPYLEILLHFPVRDIDCVMMGLGLYDRLYFRIPQSCHRN